MTLLLSYKDYVDSDCKGNLNILSKYLSSKYNLNIVVYSIYEFGTLASFGVDVKITEKEQL